MSEAVTKVRNVASYIPAKFRGVIYTALGLAVGLEMIWDFLEPGVETKVLGTLVVLGFGMALGNTGTPPEPVPEPVDPPPFP